MQSLIQTNYIRTTKYIITDEGLEIYFRSFTRKSTELIPFEEIGSIISSEKTYNKAAFYPMIFFMSISLIRLLVSKDFTDNSFVGLFFFSFIAIIILILSVRRTLVLSATGSRIIPFKPNSPSKEKVQKFIEELIKKRNQVLIMKFGNISRKLPYETQHERILWLNSIGVFSNKEVEDKKEVLNMLFACDGGKYDITLN